MVISASTLNLLSIPSSRIQQRLTRIPVFNCHVIRSNPISYASWAKSYSFEKSAGEMIVISGTDSCWEKGEEHVRGLIFDPNMVYLINSGDPGITENQAHHGMKWCECSPERSVGRPVF